MNATVDAAAVRPGRPRDSRFDGWRRGQLRLEPGLVVAVRAMATTLGVTAEGTLRVALGVAWERKTGGALPGWVPVGQNLDRPPARIHRRRMHYKVPARWFGELLPGMIADETRTVAGVMRQALRALWRQSAPGGGGPGRLTGEDAERLAAIARPFLGD